MQTPSLTPRPPIQASVDAVQADVRRNPAHADSRAHLFQWLAAAGDWARAATQLDTCVKLDAAATPMAALYRAAIAGECQRQDVFAGTTPPVAVGTAPAWLDTLGRALQPGANLPDLCMAALADAPASSGSLQLADGSTHAFDWIADGDNRLGPICEIIAGGRYGWLPFDDIASVRLDAPEGLCDLLWTRSVVELRDGRQMACLIPARYPAPQGYAALDDEVKLSRRTDWTPLGDGLYAGVGQKMWTTDQGEYPILDVRRIDFDDSARRND